MVEPVRAATSALAPREVGAFLLQSPSLLQVPKARRDFLFLLSLLVCFQLLFIDLELVMCMSVLSVCFYVHHIHTVPTGSRCQILWN